MVTKVGCGEPEALVLTTVSSEVRMEEMVLESRLATTTLVEAASAANETGVLSRPWPCPLQRRWGRQDGLMTRLVLC